MEEKKLHHPVTGISKLIGRAPPKIFGFANMLNTCSQYEIISINQTVSHTMQLTK